MRSKEDRVMKRLKSGDFRVQKHFPKDVQIAVQKRLPDLMPNTHAAYNELMKKFCN